MYTSLSGMITKNKNFR